MKKRFLPLLMVVVLTILGGCVGDDIDNLQNQIDDLNSKVDDLKKTQQEALLAAITSLQSSISDLSKASDAGDANLLAKYQTISANLTLLQQEVANNADAVFYGNLLTDADFTAFKAQGATIVTGKVNVTKQEHITALAAAKMVGGNLTISNGKTIGLPALENVGGSLVVTGVSSESATITLPKLVSVGEIVNVTANPGLTSFVANALVLVGTDLATSKNAAMATLSFAALDLVGGDIAIDEFWSGDPNYEGYGAMSSINLSGTKVVGEANLSFIAGNNLTLGAVGENISISDSKIHNYLFGGNFAGIEMKNNKEMESFDISAITAIKGNVTFNGNDFSAMGAFPTFETVTNIGGDVTISGNTGISSLEAFNNVTTMTGAKVDFNGNSADLISIFNKLKKGYAPFAWSKPALKISIYANTSWFNGFESLLENEQDIILDIAPISDDGGFGVSSVGGTASGNLKIEGFDVLTKARTLTVNTGLATEFSALGSFVGTYYPNNAVTISYPRDLTTGYCTIKTFLNAIKAGTYTGTVNFKETFEEYGFPSSTPVDKMTAVDILLGRCN